MKGHPISLSCTQCRRAATSRSGASRTGRSKPNRSRRIGSHWLAELHEWTCGECGHVGWASHPAVTSLPPAAEEGR